MQSMKHAREQRNELRCLWKDGDIVLRYLGRHRGGGLLVGRLVRRAQVLAWSTLEAIIVRYVGGHVVDCACEGRAVLR